MTRYCLCRGKEYKMKQKKVSVLFGWSLLILLLLFTQMVLAQDIETATIFYSTEEDFIAGNDSAGGNVISDGDLLIAPGSVYMRNAELLRPFGVDFDLGLDAADVILVPDKLVVYSTELAHPKKIFTAGDLLSTTGMIIPNAALLANFKIPKDLNLGLDAVQMMGNTDAIIKFIATARGIPREEWLNNPFILIDLLKQFGIDIWFSTEGTPPFPQQPQFLDGDLLSAANGTIVLSNFNALPASVPAGLPLRGVDFGMDAAACYSKDDPDAARKIYFSTEILFQGNPAFTDGDVMVSGGGKVYDNYVLIQKFLPRADFLGLDALSLEWNSDTVPLNPPAITSITTQNPADSILE